MKIVLRSFVLLGCFVCVMVGSNAVAECWMRDIPPNQTAELAEFAKRHHGFGEGEITSVSVIRSYPTYMTDFCGYNFRAKFNVKFSPYPNYHCEGVIEVTKEVTYHEGELDKFNYSVRSVNEDNTVGCSEV